MLDREVGLWIREGFPGQVRGFGFILETWLPREERWKQQSLHSTLSRGRGIAWLSFLQGGSACEKEDLGFTNLGAT